MKTEEADIRDFTLDEGIPSRRRDWPAFPKIRFTLRRKISIGVDAAFLLSMAIFLAIGFWIERGMYYEEAFAHLRETLGAIAISLPAGGAPSREEIRRYESALSGPRGPEHRLFVAGGDLRILVASTPDMEGRPLAEAFRLDEARLHATGAGVASFGGRRWLVATRPSAEGNDRLVLARRREASEGFMRTFFGIHGAQTLFTLALFGALIHVITTRYVLAPIRELLKTIRQVERLDWKAEPEIEGDDEIAWLGRRFALMARRLKENTIQLVRTQKQASVAAVAIRLGRELREPLDAIKRHALYIESLGGGDSEIGRVVGELQADRAKIVEVVKQLGEMAGEEAKAKPAE